MLELKNSYNKLSTRKISRRAMQKCSKCEEIWDPYTWKNIFPKIINIVEVLDMDNCVSYKWKNTSWNNVLV